MVSGLLGSHVICLTRVEVNVLLAVICQNFSRVVLDSLLLLSILLLRHSLSSFLDHVLPWLRVSLHLHFHLLLILSLLSL